MEKRGAITASAKEMKDFFVTPLEPEGVASLMIVFLDALLKARNENLAQATKVSRPVTAASHSGPVEGNLVASLLKGIRTQVSDSDDEESGSDFDA